MLHRKHQSTIKKASVLLKNRRKEERKRDKLSPRYLASKFIQYTTFCIKVCNVMLVCRADEALQCIESETNRKDNKYQPNSNLKEQDTDVVSKCSSAECEGINFN